MTSLATIKADYLTARKAKDPVAVPLLSTLIGEAAAIGKNDGDRETTDSEVVALIKKFIKGVNETLAVVHSDTAVAEKAILEKYLPTQYTGNDLRSIIVQSIESLEAKTQKDMGKVMKDLKFRFDGQYDGNEASKVIKELLA